MFYFYFELLPYSFYFLEYNLILLLYYYHNNLFLILNILMSSFLHLNILLIFFLRDILFLISLILKQVLIFHFLDNHLIFLL